MSKVSRSNLLKNFCLHEWFNKRQGRVDERNTVHDVYGFQFGRQRFLKISKQRFQRIDARPKKMPHPHVARIENDDQTI
jgi:hypothetical protein